jgi:hypothetical protein
MSTTFAIISPNEEEGFKRLDIAHRSGIGNGLVKIKWLDFNLRQLLDVLDVERFNKLGFKDLRPYNIHVQAMDNTAQGVKTIGDLMVLDKFGTLKNYTYENDSPTIEEIDKFESDLKNKSKYFDVEEINNDVISNTKRIKALEQDSKETNDFLYSNIQDSTIGTGLNWKLSNLNKRIEAVETLFNNINEINYINNKTKGDKNETK